MKVITTMNLPPIMRPGDKATERAILRAGSDALAAARAEAVRRVRESRAIKASAVRDAIGLRYPKGQDAEGMYSWYLVVSGKPMPIGAYPHRQVKAGVSVQIKAEGRTLIRGAFVATMRSGHEGVFVRKGKGRLPIKELFTTRVVDVFRDPGFVEGVGDRAREVFSRTLQRNLAMVRRGGR